MIAAELRRWLSSEEWADYQYATDPDVCQDKYSEREQLKIYLESLAEQRSLLNDVTLVFGLDWETYALAHNIKPGHGDSVDFLKKIEKHLLERISKCIAGYPREVKDEKG